MDVLDATVDEVDVDQIDQQDAAVTDGVADSVDVKDGIDQQTDKVDGRKFNPEWSKALKELRELHPDRADMLTKLRDHYARYQQLTELAPKGLDDVRGWKTQIDALGGAEAAAGLMERAAQMDQVDERIAAGDFSVVGELPEQMQAGFYQMVPQALAYLAENDAKAFSAAVQPHFQSALAETGLKEHLEEVYKLLGDNEQAKGLIKQAHDWITKQTSGSGAMPSGTKTVDPQVKALQDKLKTYEKGDDEKFVSSVTDASQKHLEDSFNDLAGVYVKQLGLTKEQQADLMESFNEKMTAKLGGDAAFQAQLKAYKAMKSRSPEAVNAYIKGKIDEHKKTILDSIVTTRYGAKRTQARTAPTTQATTGGALQVAKAPDQSEWDMDKMDAMGYESTVKKGLFYLKGGKSVQLVRSA